MAVGKSYITTSATRISYFLHFGAYDINMLVCHKCDNRSCVNPSHLFLGSQQDNLDDMVAKGRSLTGVKNPAHLLKHTRPRGFSHYMSKVNSQDVVEIINSHSIGKSYPEISKLFGISISTVGRIVRREIYNPDMVAYQLV